MVKVGQADLINVGYQVYGTIRVLCWKWNGKIVRKGAHAYLKNIGNGYSIRINTGEVYAEAKEKMDCALYSSD